MFGRIRKADHDECYAALGRSAEEGLMQSFAASRMAWAAVTASETIAVFGCAAASLLTDTGVPWMVGTDKVSEYRVSFARGGRRYTKKMKRVFSYLENWVDARNTLSLRWLQWCGFTIEPARPYGFEQRPFHRFYMEESRCA